MAGAGELPILVPFMMRDHDLELDALLASLRGSSIVVLIGLPGAGKTRSLYESILRSDRLSSAQVVCPPNTRLLRDFLHQRIGDSANTASRQSEGRPAIVWLGEFSRLLSGSLGRETAELSCPVVSGHLIIGI